MAAGVYAFLVVIGVYPRLIGKTATASKGKIFLYETIIALGGLFGNVVDLFTEKVETADREFSENSVASGNAGGRVVAEGSRRRWQNGSWCWISGDVWKCLRTAASSGCGTFLWYFVGCLVMSLAETLKAPAGAEPPPASGSGAAISPFSRLRRGNVRVRCIISYMELEDSRRGGETMGSQKRSI